MNITKRFNTAYLLTLPFIVVPFLITHRFQDPTLLIKRSGVFFLFLIIVLILVGMKRSRNTISNANLKWLGGMVAFILALAVISSYNSINPSESYWELNYLSGWVGIYCLFCLFGNQKVFRTIIIATSIVGGILSLLVIFQLGYDFVFDPRTTGINPLLFPDSGTSQFLSITFGNRNIVGMYLCFVIPASLVSIILERKSRSKYGHIFMFFISCIALMIIRTRAAWLGVLISLLFFIVIYRHMLIRYIHVIKKDKKTLIIIVLLGLLLFGFSFLRINSIGAHGTKSTVWSTIMTLKKIEFGHDWDINLRTNRVDRYKATIKMIQDNPIWGVGLNNWRIVNPRYLDSGIQDAMTSFVIRQRPHNDLLWIISEIGIIGFLFVLIFFIFHLKPAVRSVINIKNKAPTDSQLINTFIILSMVAIIIESMFDFPRQRIMPNLYLWSMMGFIASTFNGKKVKENYQKAVPLGMATIIIFVSVFAYFDMKSNIYSQDAKYYNNNNMPKELYASSAIALSYYRILDNAGTPIYYYMGIAKHQLGDKNAAKLFFQKALQLAPFHIGALTNYMILLGELGELTSAHKIMSIIQHVYPKMGKSRIDMAKFYLREGKNEEAEKILLELQEHGLGNVNGTRDKLLSLIAKKHAKDGSPKELGSEINTDADASSPTNVADSVGDWVESGSGAISSTTKGDEPSGTYSLHFLAAANADYIKKGCAITVVVGKVYKIQVQYIVPNGDSDTKFKIGVGETTGAAEYFLSEALNETTWTTYTNYITATSVNLHMFFSEEGNSPFDLDLYIDTISIKEVQMGNHGTTTLLGEELTTNGDMSSATGWTGSGSGGWLIGSNVATHTSGTAGDKVNQIF